MVLFLCSVILIHPNISSHIQPMFREYLMKLLSGAPLNKIKQAQNVGLFGLMLLSGAYFGKI